MQAALFTLALSLCLAIPASLGARRAEKRGLILIALAVITAIDVWVVQSPRMQAAVTTGGRLADMAIISLPSLGIKIGSLDVAIAVAFIATIATLNGLLALIAALGQGAAFTSGLWIAKAAAVPLPGAVFILVFALPFIWLTRHKWAAMPAGDKVSTAVICGLALILAVAGVIRAVI